MSSTLTLHLRGHFLQGAAVTHLIWFAAGLIVAFLMPFVFSSVLDLDHDLYYLVYFTGAAAFLAAYAQATHLDIVALFTRNWRWSLGLGVLASVFLVFRILSAEDSTPHPDGLYFAFEIGWRGVLYGIVDALLLTAFPLAVAFSSFGGRLDTLGRKAGYLALTIGLVWIITATYHLGYEQFREDGVGGPETGNTIISVPAIVTANPIGAVVAHAAMHVTATTHAYETDLYLPPQTFVDGE
jgi:hypothetical protein